MGRQYIPVKSKTGAVGAAATGTTIFTIRAGRGGVRLHTIQLRGVAVTAGPATQTAGHGQIRLKMGSNVQRGIDIATLDAIHSIYNPPSATLGTAASPLYTVFNNTNPGPWVSHMYFTEPWRDHAAAKERYALDLLEGEEIYLEIDCKSVTNAPTLDCSVEIEPLSEVIESGRLLNRSKDGSKPTLVKMFEGSVGVDASGTKFTITTIPRQDVYQLIRIGDPTGGYITQATVTIDGTIVFQKTRAENLALLRANGNNPPGPAAAAGYFDIVPDLSNETRDGWNLTGVKKFEIECECSAAPSVTSALILNRFGLPE